MFGYPRATSSRKSLYSLVAMGSLCRIESEDEFTPPKMGRYEDILNVIKKDRTISIKGYFGSLVIIEVSFRFSPPWLKAGVWVSLLGFVLWSFLAPAFLRREASFWNK